jgi:hypothetical protein
MWEPFDLLTKIQFSVRSAGLQVAIRNWASPLISGRTHSPLSKFLSGAKALGAAGLIRADASVVEAEAEVGPAALAAVAVATRLAMVAVMMAIACGRLC